MTQNINKNKSISVKHQLLTTLNWFKNGDQQYGISVLHAISTSFISWCIQRVVDAVVNCNTYMFNDTMDYCKIKIKYWTKHV